MRQNVTSIRSRVEVVGLASERFTTSVDVAALKRCGRWSVGSASENCLRIGKTARDNRFGSASVSLQVTVAALVVEKHIVDDLSETESRPPIKIRKGGKDDLVGCSTRAVIQCLASLIVADSECSRPGEVGSAGGVQVCRETGLAAIGRSGSNVTVTVKVHHHGTESPKEFIVVPSDFLEMPRTLLSQIAGCIGRCSSRGDAEKENVDQSGGDSHVYQVKRV